MGDDSIGLAEVKGLGGGSAVVHVASPPAVASDTGDRWCDIRCLLERAGNVVGE